MGGEVPRTPREADVARHTLAKASYDPNLTLTLTLTLAWP